MEPREKFERYSRSETSSCESVVSEGNRSSIEVIDLAEVVSTSDSNIFLRSVPPTRSVYCQADFGDKYPDISLADLERYFSVAAILVPRKGGGVSVTDLGQGKESQGSPAEDLKTQELHSRLASEEEIDQSELKRSLSRSDPQNKADASWQNVFKSLVKDELETLKEKMDDKIVELKERQQQLGEKILQLQETNRRKDEEAAEIRELIAECRENLNRIKTIATTGEHKPEGNPLDENMMTLSRTEENDTNDWVESENEKMKDTGREMFKYEDFGKEKKARENSGNDEERVTCKVDLNRMKVRIRGPSEDLKQLDAAQLINLLDRFQCQELVINTGEEVLQKMTDTYSIKETANDMSSDIPVIYLTHPGNIIMIAGIVVIALLVNANLCNPTRGCKMRLFHNALYLGSFAFHYGMVLWTSFIRGHSLSSGLMHDTFNLVDNIILPKYYSICVFLSAVTLYSFLAMHCAAPCTSWPIEVTLQVLVGIATFFLELSTVCYIVPALIKLRDATDDYLGVEDDDGCMPEGFDNNIQRLNKLNYTISLVNVLTVMFMGMNVYYIAGKLNVG